MRRLWINVLVIVIVLFIGGCSVDDNARTGPNEEQVHGETHNLSDFEADLYPLRTQVHFSDIDLNPWGKISLTTVLFAGHKPYAAAYLTNDNGDILYEVCPYFPTGFGVVSAEFSDLNADGLQDITFVLTSFDYDTGIACTGEDEWRMEWFFHQTEDGRFYDAGSTAF